MCTVLFMKALPGTMETNYLLTMWNRILFTRLRFPLLFQMRFFTASSFVSHSIIVSIFQNQSVSRKEQKKKNESLLFIKQAIRCIYECTPHQTPPLHPPPNHPSVQSFQWHYPPEFYLKPNTVCSMVECPLWKAALGEIWGMFTRSEQRQEAIREQRGNTLNYNTTVSLHHRAAVNKPGIHFIDYQHLILRLTKQSI